MKKIILTITLLTFSLFMVGCGGPDTEDKGNEEKINNVIQLIDELPLSAKIDATHKEQIKEAREAYDALTEVEKASVTNYAKLTTSESKLTRVLEAEDEETIEEIEELISLLPSIDQLSVNDRPSVDAIDELITKLHLKTRNDIPNILIFDIAKGQVEYLEEEEILNQAAKEVMDLIDALPNIDDLTLEDALAVEEARNAYETMIEGAKYKVTNLNVLVELEYVIQTLKEFQDFDPRDVLDCIDDVLTSDTNDLIITEGENFTVEWSSTNDKLVLFEDGHVKVSKVHQTHRKQNVTITADIKLVNNDVITLTKVVTVNPVKFAEMPSTPVATYFQSSALSNYTRYSERYLEEGTLFSDKSKDVLDIIYYAFANIDEAGNVTLSNYDIVDDLHAMKAYDTRVVLCIAGVSTAGSQAFNKLTKDDALRAKFVNNIMNVVETYNFDGVDIDWESTGSSPVVAVQMNKLMKDLRAEMTSRQDPNGSPYLLSAAVPASSWGAGTDRFDFKTLNNYVDYINMMSYDMNKTTNATHLSPLYKSSYDNGYGFGCHYGFELFTSRGLDASKIIIGSAGYGKSYKMSGTVSNTTYPALGLSASLTYLEGIPGAHASGTLFYNAIEKVMQSTQYKKYIEYNKNGQIVGSYLYNEYSKIFITYDSEEVITAKYEYAEAVEGMGIMCWAYTEDTADNFVNSIYDAKHDVQ